MRYPKEKDGENKKQRTGNDVGFYSLFLLFLLIVLFSPCKVHAQDQMITGEDSIRRVSFLTPSEKQRTVDSVVVAEALKQLDTVKSFHPNPAKAAIYSAIFPGLGQIYNRKYWKLPLVYGSFLGCTYAITWNNTQYNGYKRAYVDFIDGDANTNSWLDYRPYTFSANEKEWPAEDRNWFSNNLKAKKDYFRRYRDMSYFIAVGVYAICIIDAYVDAQLFDFDISPDLSMRIDPVIYERTNISSRTMGLQCSFTF
jgi:hypothetical protein